MQVFRAASAAILLFCFCAFAGCVTGSPEWSMTINDNSTFKINNSVYASIAGSNETINGVDGVPLEQFLYLYELYPVTSVSIGSHTYNWSSLASTTDRDQPVLVLPDGSIFDGQELLKTSNIIVKVSARPEYSSLDIGPSMLYALDIGGDDTLITNKTDHVVLFYVDAMGYERYEQAKSKGLINNITSLGEPEKITCVYPSISIVNSKTLVSGIPPNASKGNFREYFPDGPTIPEAAVQNGLTAYWIDGKTSPVNLGDYAIYCPDKNKNGYEADEVTTEAIEKYCNEANLLYVHFKDTDSVAHDHGPYSDESMSALQFADAQIGRMLPWLDPGTVVIIYADHGGHVTFDGGNHGTLIPEDMIVPFIVYVV